MRFFFMSGKYKASLILFSSLFFLYLGCTSQGNVKDLPRSHKAPSSNNLNQLSNTLLVVEVPYKRLPRAFSQKVGKDVGMQHGAVGAAVGTVVDGIVESIEKNNLIKIGFTTMHLVGYLQWI